MKLFEGKTSSERNKIILALVLGVFALLAVINLVFSPFSGSKKVVTVNVSPSPTASASPNRSGDAVIAPLPKQNEINDIYTRTPVAVQYPPAGGDAGRNIFAFYEPPLKTPFSPTPYVPPTPKPLPPTPTPPIPNVILSFIGKQSVYAGEKSFKLEVGGDKFTPDTPIWFGGTPLPTTFISPQQLSAEIPANYVVSAGQKQVEVKSADGKLFSNPLLFNIQQPPFPQFQYLGIVSRKRGNNDTAYIMETGKTMPSTVRLNDLVGGRFRVISISQAKLLVQDIQLTFLAPYPIELVKGTGQSSSTTNPRQPNSPFSDGSMIQPNPQFPNQQCPPGIPCDNLRRVQPNPNQPQKPEPDDVDDDGDN